MKLLIATNNKGKIRELERMLHLPGVELVSPQQAGLPDDFDVEETGQTYAENAILKANQYALAAGLLTLADDSGIEIAALNGEPGVYSKRYAGEDATDQDRINLVLSKLKDTPNDQLSARFMAVIALARPDGTIIETQEGICPGQIVRTPRGSNGFGYDPIFEVAGENGRTMSELDDHEKDGVSHRGLAVAKIRPTLEKLLQNEAAAS